MNTTKTSDIVPDVEKELKRLRRNAPFLERDSSEVGDSSIAVFSRDEVQTGHLLGEGCFCHVYEVKSVSSREPNEAASSAIVLARQQFRENVESDGRVKYAMKHLKKELLKREREIVVDAAVDLVLEATYLAKLSHPNIVKMVGMSQGSGASPLTECHDGYFILMEQFSETLGERIDRWSSEMTKPKKSMIKQKCHYAYQIANALLYLHKRRIVFRDMKPQNVGFQGEQVKLFDFGMCRELPPDNHSENDLHDIPASGTPRYTCPEVLTDGKCNLKADVYSWAVVTYEMFSHKRAFAHYSLKQFYVAVCVRKERPKLSNLGLPRSISQIVSKAWEHDVAKRPNISPICKTLKELTPERSNSNKLLSMMAASLQRQRRRLSIH